MGLCLLTSYTLREYLGHGGHRICISDIMSANTSQVIVPSLLEKREFL